KGRRTRTASVRRAGTNAAGQRCVRWVTPIVRIATPKDCGRLPGPPDPRAGCSSQSSHPPMRTYTATTTSTARPSAVLAVLTDPDAVARWAPVDFYVDDLTHPRLSEGSRARVSGRLAGQRVGFDVEVHQADEGGLA